MRILIVILVLFISSCTSSSLKENELQEFIAEEDNGLIKYFKVGDMDFEVKFMPSKLLVWNNIKNVKKLANQSSLDSLSRSFDALLYFIVNISVNSNSLETVLAGTPTYTQVMEHLNYGMASTISIRENENIIVPLDVVHEKSYGLNKSTNILVAFKKSSIGDSKKFHLIIEDPVFNIPKTEIQYFWNDINNVPELKL